MLTHPIFLTADRFQQVLLQQYPSDSERLTERAHTSCGHVVVERDLLISFFDDVTALTSSARLPLVATAVMVLHHVETVGGVHVPSTGQDHESSVKSDRISCFYSDMTAASHTGQGLKRHRPQGSRCQHVIHWPSGWGGSQGTGVMMSWII